MKGGSTVAGTYRTLGRERLLRFLESHPDTPYTVDELALALHTDGSAGADKQPPRIGKSSLYRQLAEMVADGTVRRDREACDSLTADSRTSAAVYRYVARPDCARHFHLQCVSCGRLLHLDCALTSELLAHIRTDHHFLVNMGRSVLYGRCEACVRNEEHEEHADSPKKLQNNQ